MKTREIRQQITARGFDQGVIHVLEAQNEMLLQTRRDLTELATYFDKVVELTGNMADGVAKVRDKIQDMEAKQDDGLGISTNSLDKE